MLISISFDIDPLHRNISYQGDFVLPQFFGLLIAAFAGKKNRRLLLPSAT